MVQIQAPLPSPLDTDLTRAAKKNYGTGGGLGSGLDSRWGVGEKSVGVSRKAGAGGSGAAPGGWRVRRGRHYARAFSRVCVVCVARFSPYNTTPAARAAGVGARVRVCVIGCACIVGASLRLRRIHRTRQARPHPHPLRRRQVCVCTMRQVCWLRRIHRPLRRPSRR